MDDFQARALGNLRKRHEDKIRQDAEIIRTYIGYVLGRLDGGNVTAAAPSALRIASSAAEIAQRLAALDAIEEMAGILETTDG